MPCRIVPVTRTHTHTHRGQFCVSPVWKLPGGAKEEGGEGGGGGGGGGGVPFLSSTVTVSFWHFMRNLVGERGVRLA